MPVRFKRIANQVVAYIGVLMIAYCIVLLIMDPQANFDSVKNLILMIGLIGLVTFFSFRKASQYKRHRSDR